MKHPCYIKNTYDFVDKIAMLVIPEECLLIALNAESVYTNIVHAKGLNKVCETLQFRGTLYASTMQLLELSLKYNDFLFNDQWYNQATGTSMDRDRASHYADIYMGKFEKEALYKAALK